MKIYLKLQLNLFHQIKLILVETKTLNGLGDLLKVM